MHPNKGYDLAMQSLKSSALILLAMALLTPLSRAQVRGTPAPDSQHHTSRSVTVAPAAQGHTGVMPTPIGVSPAPAPAFPAPTPIGVPPMLTVPGANNTAGNGFHHHHHRDSDDFVRGAYPVYVPVPVVVDPYSMYQTTPDQADQETDDTPVSQGPTVFERRTPDNVTATESLTAAPSAEETTPAGPDASPATPDSASSQPAQPQEPSLLVFRDGRQLEVQNYAIVGDSLYDFTPGHARKVPLSQLDLPATVKANDDRGLDFTLPGSKGGS
ncbi:MAG TPA: hypothetical protein VJN48_06420 [Terriglobales bacterium]|nr:hypothetical protein [Terriglobales bacterium]